MNGGELYEIALVRITGGETINAVVATLYGNRRQYKKETTPVQRGSLARARAEFLEKVTDKPRNQYPRLFIETTAERQLAVRLHCKEQGISIARFVNSAIAEALRVAKGKA